MGKMTSPSISPLGAAAMSDAHLRTIRTVNAAASSVPKSQFGGLDHLKKFANVLLDNTALSQLHQHLCQRNWTQFA